jgi:hypothetical protein
MSYLTDAQLDNGALGRRLDKDPYLIGNSYAPKNLLTVNQSTVETDASGFASVNLCTVARSTAQFQQGAASLLVTATGTTTATIGAANAAGWAMAPVSAGKVYTAKASALQGVGTRTAFMRIAWYTQTYAFISYSDGTATTINGSTWTPLTVTAVAPATAAYALFEVGTGTGSISDTYYVDTMGFWEGAGGKWVAGGERLDPSTLGRYVDESSGRRIFEWDYLNNRWQMTYGDTGWRDMSASLTNGWIAGNILLRRMGNQSFLSFTGLNGASASADSFLTAPAGWARPIPTNHYVPMNITTTTLGVMMFASSAWSTPRAACTAGSAHISWPSSDAWPTTLPGTAYGVIPQ